MSTDIPPQPESLLNEPPSLLAARQIEKLPKDELDTLAETFGVDPTRYKTRQHLIAALDEHRAIIGMLDREAMLELVQWGRRPVAANASREQLAIEVAQIRSMKFTGLGDEAMRVLARLRGCDVKADDPRHKCVRLMKKQEGFLGRFARKRRAIVGSLVSKIVGGEDEPGEGEYQFLPANSPSEAGAAVSAPVSRASSIKDEIEESGLFGGLTSRIKRTADSYLNQKLDEIEQRIDRKLDEIDRRLADWRDKEIANRIRILKITLWASVVVSLVSLSYLYVTTYSINRPGAASTSQRAK